MNLITCTLTVLPKGVDLVAATAQLTLRNQMGYTENLIGLKRMDVFRFTIATGSDPRSAITNLKRVLDRQSTFYNRNKHLYALECSWPGDPEGGSHSEGVSREDLRQSWKLELANYLQTKGDRESCGKDPTNPLILGGSSGFLVEVLVEDDDPSTRDAIAVKVKRDLSGVPGTEDARVSCENRGVVWWLALRATAAEAAEETARHITLTKRRDAGLLANPNYEHAEFVSARQL